MAKETGPRVFDPNTIGAHDWLCESYAFDPWRFGVAALVHIECATRTIRAIAKVDGFEVGAGHEKVEIRLPAEMKTDLEPVAQWNINLSSRWVPGWRGIRSRCTCDGKGRKHA